MSDIASQTVKPSGSSFVAQGVGPQTMSLQDAAAVAFEAMSNGPLRIFDNQLTALYYANSPQAQAMAAYSASVGQYASSLVNTADGLFVLVDCIAADRDGAALLSQLKALGLQGGSSYGAVTSGYLPVSQLGALLNVGNIVSAHESAFETSIGLVTTQADAAQHADVARTSYGVTGAGLKIGVISNSFNTAPSPATTPAPATTMAQDIANNDLPSDTVVVQDFTSSDPNNKTTDEGRGMAQLIHDLAPDAGIRFATANYGQAGFANNIIALANSTNDAKVIVDDVIYYGEPAYQNGVIAQAVSQVVAAGVSYFSSAGNNGIEGYQGSWVSGGAYTYMSGNYTLMNFAPGQDYIAVTLGSRETIILQWDSPAASAGGAGATTDLDLFLTDASGAVVSNLVSTSNNIGGDPVEGLSLTGGTGGTYYLRVGAKSTSALPTNIRVLALGNGSAVDLANPASNTNQGTVYGHAVADGAIGVAAAGYANTPTNGVTPPVAETFTSRGVDTLYFTNSGVRLSTPVTYSGALITAVDGGNTSFFGTDDSDADSFPNFYGTSAAAPDAAAVALLLLQKDPTITKDDILGLLQSSSIDMDDRATTGFDTGFDQSTGSGLIQADRALAFLTSHRITNNGDSPFLRGTHYNETLIGGSGADVLAGAGGADTLTGGSGADTFVYLAVADSTASARDTITDFQTGVDKVDVSAAIGSGGAVVMNRSGESTLFFFQTASGAGGQAQVQVNGPVQGYDVITGANTTFFINGAAGADTLIGAPNATNYLSGGDGADTLTGGSGTDYFRYFNVSDSTAGARDTITNFQTGVDKIDLSAAIGSGGAVVLNRSGESTGLFFQTANGAGGQAQVAVNGPVQGYDVITGANTTFFINGAAGADTLIGAPNATNYLSGGQGADTLTGGSGTDYFRYFNVSDSTAGARDTITNFQTGVDKIDLSAAIGSGGAVVLNRSGESTGLFFQTANGAGGQAQVAVNGPVQGYDVITGANTTFFINGAAGADTLIGAPNATNYLSGGQGADTLTGGSGTDYFRYFNVSDSIPGARDTITNFQTGVDKLDVSAAIGSGGAVVLNRSGESTLFFFQTANGAGGQAQVQVNGPVQGYDVITGANTTFFINGADGADTLIGAPNATNYLSGGQGADTLTGGSGTDYFRYFGLGDSTASARDTITNFQTGVDKIDISALGGGQVSLSYNGPTTIVNFTPSGGGTQLQLLAVGQVTSGDVLTSGGVTFSSGAPVDDGLQAAPALQVTGHPLDVGYGHA